jgi:hypothetical protein
MKTTYFGGKYAPAVLIAFVTKIFWTAEAVRQDYLIKSGADCERRENMFFKELYLKRFLISHYCPSDP